MSGTFNQLNTSLKINQRKEKKQRSDQVSHQSQSEAQSQKSSKGGSKQNGQVQQNLPPPPLLVQKMTQSFNSKLPPPPQLISMSDKTKSTPVSAMDKISLSNISSKMNSKKDASPMSRPKKEEDIIKEESHDFSGKSDSSSQLDFNGGKNNEDKNQDQRPFEEDPFIININLKDHNIQEKQQQKIPNNNYSLLNQAKFALCQSIQQQNEQEKIQLNEAGLSYFVALLHSLLIKQKEDELQKLVNEQSRQNGVLQQQLTQHLKAKTKLENNNNNSNNNQLLQDNQQQQLNNAASSQNLEEIKKLREENQEMRMKNQFLEQDLQFQAQRAKDLQTKYESEIENLRSQLKGSQSEQFVRQQVEHKKLIEDNAVLMREVKILQDQLRDEQQKVIELFEDAQTVRDEILREMGDYERTKLELQKLKILNKNLKKRLNENSIDFSEDQNISSFGDETTPIDDTLGGGEIKKKKQKKMVSVAVSRAESLISLAENFNHRVEELIDQKSRSIAEVITQGQITSYYKAYQNPYAGVPVGQQQYTTYDYNMQSSQSLHNNRIPYQNQVPYSNNNKHKVVELSINESEGRLLGNNSVSSGIYENPNASGSSEKKPMHSNSSDLQILKHKIKEMRDKHNSQLQESMMKNSSQQSIQSIPPLQQINSGLRSNAQSQTLLAMTQGLISQDYDPKAQYRNTATFNMAAFSSLMQQNQKQEEQLAQQFKTPVFTEQNNQQQYNSDQLRKAKTQKEQPQKTYHHQHHQSFNIQGQWQFEEKQELDNDEKESQQQEFQEQSFDQDISRNRKNQRKQSSDKDYQSEDDEDSESSEDEDEESVEKEQSLGSKIQYSQKSQNQQVSRKRSSQQQFQ